MILVAYILRCPSYRQQWTCRLLIHHNLKLILTSCINIQSRHVSIFGHIACMDDDADAKMILGAPHQRTGREHQGILVSHGWTPSSAIWEPTTSHSPKQSTWLRTVLCGGWCLRMVLCPTTHARKEEEDWLVDNLDIPHVKWSSFSHLPSCCQHCLTDGSTRWERTISVSELLITKAPFTRCNLLSNRFDNWLYRVYKHSTGCQTRFDKPVVQPSLTTCWRNSGCSFNTVVLSNPFDNGFDNRLYRVYEHSTGCQLVWQPVVQPYW